MAEPNPPVTSTARSSWRWLTAAALLLLAFAIVRMSWLGDDAFITFRSVENMVDGLGPRWNVDERVQTYTHPLWFLLLCLARWATGEMAVTAQVLCTLVSLGAVLWLVRLLRAGPAAVAVLLLGLGSRAFHVYATSGLETPLTYLLLVALVAALGTKPPERRLARVALVCGLLGTTRLDLLVLGGPALLACLRDCRHTVRAITIARVLLIGLSPLLSWSAFAIVYYGTPFPITAYAKAFCHGVPAGDLAAQGLRYLLRNGIEDPLTVTTIAAGIVVGLARPGQRALAVGALLYTAYVVKVGGDYMLGRFLVPPFFLAVAVLGQRLTTARPRLAIATMVAAGVVTCVPGVPRALHLHWQPDPPYGLGADGIVEEQVRGQWDHGLCSPHRQIGWGGAYGSVLRAEGVTKRLIHAQGAVGWIGFGAGTHVHIVDPWLCDPLLARLPLAEPGSWRIGHFFRRIPAWYLESLAAGVNRIPHPGLAGLFDAVQSATRDPVWSARRWRHLWELWTGHHTAGLADFVATQYRMPPRIDVPLASLSAPVPPGTLWFEVAGARTAQAGGLAIAVPAGTQASAVVVYVTSAAAFEVTFRREGVTVGSAPTGGWHALERLQGYRVAVPDGASPFDTIWIDAKVPLEAPATAMVGGIELVR